MVSVRLWIVLLIVCFTSIPFSSKADWINLTGAETAPNIAEITIFDDRVEVALEIYIGDLATFAELVPNDWLKPGEVERPPPEQRLRYFSEQILQFVTDTGEQLQAQLRVAEPRLRKDRFSPFAGMVIPYTGRRVPEAPADKRVLYAELVYPFGRAPPKTLTIIPPLDKEGRARVDIGFITYHKSVPVIDFRYLGGRSTLTLDPDPWYSSFDNPNLKRHHKYALMSFLYVEPYEVRHEILTRIKDLDEWMDLGLRGDRYIEIDELEPLKQRIGEFLLHRNPVTVDGEALKPILDRSNYVKVGLTGIQILDRSERLEIVSAIVGVIITYITEGMPQQATVDWELFTEQIQRVPATAVDPAGPLFSYVEPGDNRLTWTNFLNNYELPTVRQIGVTGTLGELRVPVLTLLCLVGLLGTVFWLLVRVRRGKPVAFPLVAAALLLVAAVVVYPFARFTIFRPALIAGELDDEHAGALLQTLLKNVYRAFDFRDEEDVYDKLALSVSGDLLTNIYLQNRRSMKIQRAGGAQARIKEVAVEQASAERLDGDGLTYALHGRWTALGTVGHWGHVHQRKNRYDAVVTVSARDGIWKIVGLELRDEQRIDPSFQAGVEKPPGATDSAPGEGAS